MTLRRRTPLRRKARLRARSPLRRRTPLRPVNTERRKRLRAKQYGEYAEHVRAMPCLVCERGPSVAAHGPKTRGAGGTARDLVPLCIDHEMQLHSIGRETFEERHEVDLRAAADRLWNEHGGES